MKLYFMILSLQLIAFDSFSQSSSSARRDEEICTVYTAIMLPVRLGTSSAQCASVVNANPLSLIGCKKVAEMLIDPISWWDGTVDNCKISLREVREGNYVKATITIIGQRKNAEKILDAFKKSGETEKLPSNNH